MAPHLSPMALVAMASLGLLAVAAAPSPSGASVADLRRDPGRCTASDPSACRAAGQSEGAAAFEDASLVQLPQLRKAAAGARAGSFLDRVVADDLIQCFQKYCNHATESIFNMAGCVQCLWPFQGKASMESVMKERVRAGIDVTIDMTSNGNPYGGNIPNSSFTAKAQNSASPMGYLHLCKGDVEHCKPTYDDECYGPNSICLTKWQDVMDWGPQIPEGQWNGTIWRGQELGTGFLSPYPWSARGIDPYTALGVTPSQHYAIRPAAEKAFGSGPKNSAEYQQTDEMIRAEVKQFFAEKKKEGLTVGFTGDVIFFVHRVLYRHVFKQECSDAQAKAFVMLQLATLGTALQKGDMSLMTMFPGLHDAIAAAGGRLVESYEPMVEALYGDLIAGEDCSPSKSCATQLASAILDGFMLAGGVSLTFSINAGLALLFSTAEPSGTPFSGLKEVQNPPEAWKHWGNPFPQRAYEPGQELQFYWEVLRYFAPVGSLASWKTAPTCAGESAAQTKARFKPDGRSEPCKLGPVDPATGLPKINQYAGGDGHVYPSLPVAQRDPTRWGPDANEFKIRDLEVYKWSVGFGEMAVNDKVANGRMNRVCPGKSLTLMLGSIFFEEFNKEDWVPPRIASNITFTQGSKPTSQKTQAFAPEFTLSSKAMVEGCKEVCPAESFAKEAEECRAANTACKCAQCKAEGMLKEMGDFDCLACLR